LRSAGTLRKSSRTTLAMIGTAMIVSTTEAVRIPFPAYELGSPLKIGSHPRNDFRNGSRWCCMKGPRTRIPQRPRMTLGIAASISTSAPIVSRRTLGASSVR